MMKDFVLEERQSSIRISSQAPMGAARADAGRMASVITTSKIVEIVIRINKSVDRKNSDELGLIISRFETIVL